MEVPPKIIRIIRAMYKNTAAQFSIDKNIILEILSGVREGGKSSPIKFNIFINKLLKLLKAKSSECGVMVGLAVIVALLYADDIFLCSKTASGLQKLIDICYEFGRKWHISFGVKKCQVVLGPGTPRQDYRFAMGAQSLDIVSYYRYLGIEETCNGLDYSVFLEQKWKKIKTRIPMCQKAGARGDGLSFHSIRILYYSQVRPIIEYGLELIPQDSTKSEIEKMQRYALCNLTGARRSTKYESILLCLGITKMETRVHQLKIFWYNKLKKFADSLYVHKIFEYTMTHGRFRIELENIFQKYRIHPKYDEWLAECENPDFHIPKIQMKMRTDKIMGEIDFAASYQAARDSVTSTGQARMVVHATSILKAHHGGLCILNNHLWLPSERTLFFQVLVGSNFLTPFNHSNKPDCKFCNEKNISWSHFFCKCPDYQENQKPKILKQFTKALSTVHKSDRLILTRLSNPVDDDDFFKLCLGILSQNAANQIRFKKTVSKVTKISANLFTEINDRWFAAT